METKLKAGDIIGVQGFSMFAKLDNGQKYKVKQVSEYYGKKVYDFSKPKSNKVIVRHLANSIDYCLSDQNHPDYNKIYKVVK